MRGLVYVAGIVGLLVSSSCAPEQPPYEMTATTEELMHGMVNPLAEVVFESVGYSVYGDPETGETIVEEISPDNDEEWEQVVDSALALAESANLLLFPERAADYEGDWIELSQEMMRTSRDAAEVARTRNVDLLLETGSYLYESCLNCHEKYLPENSELPAF